jgi:large subunit ribosomal protein L27
MAHKKGQSSSRNGRDSNSQRRGVKAHDGQVVTGGTIIVRQVGNRFHPGQHVGQGRDFTLYARIPGRIRFFTKGNGRQYVAIEPVQAVS